MTYILAGFARIEHQLDSAEAASRALASLAGDSRMGTLCASLAAARKELNGMRTGADRVRQVASDLCSYTRPDVETVGVVDISAVVAEVLALVRKPEVDLVYCDLMMKGLTGMDLHERLTTAVPDRLPRIVFITGGAFTPHAANFCHAGGTVVLKPLDVLAKTRRRLGGASGGGVPSPTFGAAGFLNAPLSLRCHLA